MTFGHRRRAGQLKRAARLAAWLAVTAPLLYAVACGGSSSDGLPMRDQPACTVPGSTLGEGPACIALDMDPVTPGLQATRVVEAGATFDVDVWIRGVPAVEGLGAYYVVVTYNSSHLQAALPRAGPGLRDLMAAREWDCGGPDPKAALGETHPLADGDSSTGDAYISCYAFANDAPTAPRQDTAVATLTFTAIGTGRSEMRLSRGQAALNLLGGPPFIDCEVADQAIADARCLDGEVDVQ